MRWFSLIKFIVDWIQSTLSGKSGEWREKENDEAVSDSL
jgi:hypothetical protein